MFGVNISIEKVKDIFNLKPQTLLIISFIAWSIILIPESIIMSLGLSVFRDSFKPYIGIIALVATFWFISYIFVSAYHYFERLYFFKNTIEDLSPIEKALLSLYVDNNSTSIGFNYNDGVVMGLKAKGILYIPSNISKGGTIFDFNMQPRYYSYLKKKPELLMEGRNDVLLDEIKRKGSFNW